MDPHVDLQNSAPSPPQEQTQTTPSESPPPAPAPAVPQDVEVPRRPSHNELEILKAQKEQRRAELCALSKTFGNIPGVEIFDDWGNRQECCNSAVHRSVMAGICGNGKEGAFSIALSSLYKDDEDGGDVIIYTGSGGRERYTDTIPPKRLRLGPQTMDQSWDDSPNKALLTSSITGKPVRVVRTYRCQSQYAPLTGVRYDGLYKVAAVWTAKGRNNKKICRARLERLPDQPPIPLRPPSLSTSRRGRRKRLASHGPSPLPDDVPDAASVDSGSNEPNPSPTQLAGDIVKAEESSDPRRLQSIPGTSAFALPRYRWDPKTSQLVRIIPVQRDGEDRRAEDEATLVSSEDSHLDRVSNDEPMETESFTDSNGPPQF